MRTNTPGRARARAFCAVAASLTALACASGLPARADAQPEADSERALASYAAMQQQFYEPWHHLYRGEEIENAQEFAFFWPFTQTLAATTAVAGIPGAGEPYLPAIREHISGLRWYWNGRSRPHGYESNAVADGGGWKYYDDNEWTGLQLVRAFRMLGDRSLLARAAELFELVVYGWDTNRRHACRGGVWLTQRPGSLRRNTVSNAPAAELGLELYQLTRRAYYLQWARRMYHWVRTCLRESRGLYADNIDPYGAVEDTIWIYNQGTMIGAEALLYQVTGNGAYLSAAQEDATTALRYFNRAQLEEQPVFFVAIFADNLLRLNAIAPDSRYRSYVQSYADRAWNAFRNPETGLFDFREREVNVLLQQAAMTQLYAYLSWGGRWYEAPPG
jgi:Glycosyl hydrolase family 76